jgi:Secretion system C-terminal sorting domain
MKKQLLVFAGLMLLVHFGFSQTMTVNPGPSGTLNQAIANNPNVKVFILKRNFPYLLSGELVLTTDITIKAEAGAGKRPIILYGPPPGAPTIEQLIRTSANLRLEGLHLTNRDNLGGISQRMIRTAADNIRIETHDCVFDDSGQTAFRLDSKGTKIYVVDCIASRLGQPNNPDNGRFIDDRGNQVDSVVIHNSAIYNVTSRIYRDGGEVVNYMQITNSTFMNAMQRGFEIGRVKQFRFLNNICADLQINGRDSSAIAANNEPSSLAAWIRIDSTGTGGENWTIGYSNFFYTPEQASYYAFPFTNDDGDTVLVAPFFNPNAINAIAAGGWQNTIISEVLNFKNAPVFPEGIADTFNFGATANALPWNMDGLTPDPVYSQLPAGTDRYVIFHDFNYSCDKQSNTASLTGGRLGAQLTGDCFVSVRDLFDEYGVLFYPNPATDRLVVQGVENIVQVQLFDLNGQLLRSLQPNDTWLELPLNGLPNGLYFVTLSDTKGRISARQLVKN